MEMHQIRYFLAVCETLNFTRAAEQCHVTQPALTRGVQKLEEELGGLLFRRERSLTHLTDLGQLMRRHLSQVLSEAEAAQSTAKSFLNLDNAELNLGMMCSIGPLRMAAFLTEFADKNPGIRIALHEASPEALKEQLREGKLDIAVMAQLEPYDERYDALPLYRERFVVGFAHGHRFEKMNAVALGELRGERYLARLHCEIAKHIYAMRMQHGAEMDYGIRTERDDWIQVMVGAGLGVCIVPAHTPILPTILSRPIIDPVIERELRLVTVAGRRFSPAELAFKRFMQSRDWGAPAEPDAPAASKR
ncbi:MAG: LysR family transcriptional regulator [Alphaproteobacteria bacterium]|nr:LysR family transcriptional regulator [Alphaproteobacteria bacterium]